MQGQVQLISKGVSVFFFFVFSREYRDPIGSPGLKYLAPGGFLILGCPRETKVLSAPFSKKKLRAMDNFYSGEGTLA